MTANNGNNSHLDYTDEELARQAAAGSHAAFETIVFRYSARLLQFMCKRIPTRQDAEDLTQETFIKAYRNIHRFDPQYSLSTWLYTIASRLAISHYRSARWKMDNLTGPDGIDTAVESGPETIAHELETRRNLWLKAKTLKKEFHEALWLRYVEEMTVKEIAGVMNRSQINVRVLLHRARAKLTRLLAQQEYNKFNKNESKKESYDVLFSS